MSWPKNFPTFHGGVPGKSILRQMETEAGGMDGIRRVDYTPADGTHYILNTRNGMPRVLTTKPDVAKKVEAARGFVAHNVGDAVAVRFSPYTLEAYDPKYPIFNHGYTVQPFASPYNVPLGDTTKWGDVLSFVAGQAFVNGKAMTTLGVTGAPLYSIPWLIPASGDGVTKYGDSVAHRVFSVGSTAVRSWASGGVEITLDGQTYRNDNKAMVCGAGVTEADNVAAMSQLVYTGLSWDHLFSGWGQYIAKVAMSLASPFLTGEEDAFSVEGFTTSPDSQGSHPVNENVPYAPKPAPVCASGILYQAEKIVDATYGSTSVVKFVPSLTDIYMKNAEASSYKLTAGTFAAYGGETAQTTPAVRGDLTTTISVSKTYSTLTETLWVELSGDTPATTYTTQASKTEYVVSRDNGTSPYFNTEPDPASAYGENNVFVAAFGIGVQAYTNSAYFTVEVDTVAAQCVLSTFHSPLVKVDASIYERIGREARLEPAIPTISPYDGTPPNVWVSLLAEEWWAYAQVEQQTALRTEGGAEVDKVAGKVLGKPLYSSGRLSAIGYVDSDIERHDYTATVAWESRDFVLFDADEQIYIYVLGTCTGEQGSGNGNMLVKVSLEIDVRGAVSSIPLESYGLSQIELLSQEYMGLGTSLNYLPAPKIRPMFFPKYQEQGAFRGAAYTTTSEHTRGATPATLFNFVLKLDTYGDIGSHEDSDSLVRFIPCNLLEMLYGYVFSTKYGVDSVRRYPVDYYPRFTNIMNTLFAKQYRINYRDGALVDWLDTLGADYATATTTELYRI